jgi:hypothetical protein
MDPVTTGGAALRGRGLLIAGCADSAARRAALWGGRGGGNLARPSPPLAPALPANPGFRNSRFHFRPPALLANPGFQNSRFHFRPPALLANPGFQNSRFHFRPPALLANPGFRNSRFHFRPPAKFNPFGFFLLRQHAQSRIRLQHVSFGPKHV